jgi:hypothetical protein
MRVRLQRQVGVVAIVPTRIQSQSLLVVAKNEVSFLFDNQ